MAKKKINKKNLFLVIAVLFFMSVMPGEGWKASNQQALKEYDEYPCTIDADCPVCAGAGIVEYNESATTHGFFEELSYSGCIDHDNNEDTSKICYLSDACLVWDCGSAQDEDTCKSIKQTILDNTLVKFNENPVLLFGVIIFIVAFIML